MSSDYSMMVADIDTPSTKIFEGQKGLTLNRQSPKEA